MKKFAIDIDRLRNRIATVVKRTDVDVGDEVSTCTNASVHETGVVREIRGMYALVDWNNGESQYEYRDSLNIFNGGYEHPLPPQESLSPSTEVTAVFDGDISVRCGVARSAHEKTAGLTRYAYLPPDTGLVFPFPGGQDASFHMSTVSYPIDIVFVKSDKETGRGVVAKIARNIQPSDKRNFYNSDTLFVVEVNGGWCDKFGVREGTAADLIAMEGLGTDSGNGDTASVTPTGTSHPSSPVGTDENVKGIDELSGMAPGKEEGGSETHPYRQNRG